MVVYQPMIYIYSLFFITIMAPSTNKNKEKNKEHTNDSLHDFAKHTKISTDLYDNIWINHELLEKERSLRFFDEIQQARKKFYYNEYCFLNLWGWNEPNFQQQLEAAQKNYEKNYRKLKKLEHILDKNRNVMMQWVTTYEDLLLVALWEIDEYGLDSMASFPIFSFWRGKGDPIINCDVAQTLIRHFSDSRIFNQIPYLDMHLPDDVTITQNLKEKFDNFYIPLLKSGKIKKLYMMPWWEKAPGCVTEHDIAKQEGIEISYPKAYPWMGTTYW